MANLISRFFRKNTPVGPGLTPTNIMEQWGNSYFYPLQMAQELFYGDTGDYQYLKQFLEVPEVNAIINIKAKAHINGRIGIVSKRTGDPYTGQSTAPNLMLSPNWFQTHKEFTIQTNLFRNIFGNEYLYLLIPTGTSLRRVKALFTLPPQLVDIKTDKETKEQPYIFNATAPEDLRYTLKWADKIYTLTTENIQHLNDNRVNFGDGTKNNQPNYLKGISHLKPLNPAIENIRGAYESRHILIYHRGALGIMTNEQRDQVGNLPLDEQDKKDLQTDYAKYGLTKKQWQILITNMSLKWQSMAMNVKQLGLFEEVVDDTIKICDAFGVPYELLGSEKGVTYDNQNNAEKRMYQNTIIPEAIERTQALNRLFRTDQEQWFFTVDFSHLPIFSENLLDKANTFNVLVSALNRALGDNAITVDEYRQQLIDYGFKTV